MTNDMSDQSNNTKCNDAIVSDCDDDEMNDPLQELLNTTTHTNSMRAQSTQAENNELAELYKRNRVLLSVGEQSNGDFITADHANNNNINRGSSGDSSSNGESSSNNRTSTKNTTHIQGDNRILISKPQQAGETEGTKKFKVDKKKSPEIVVFNIGNKKDTFNHLKGLLGHDRIMFRNINKDKTAILTENNTDRKKILEFLNNNYSRYFTYTPINKKLIKKLTKVFKT
jgi:hypothetical protein